MTSTVTPDLDENANSAHVALTTISGLDSGGQHVADFRAYVGANNRNDGVLKTRKPVRLAGSWKGRPGRRGQVGLGRRRQPRPAGLTPGRRLGRQLQHTQRDPRAQRRPDQGRDL
ncbi:hypothetical protein ACRAWD_16700 [Caulobacter segnis]